MKITCFFFFSFIVWFFRHFVFLYISFCISCLTRIADVTPHIRISTSIDYSTTTRPRPNAFISMLSSVLLLLLLTFFFLMCQFNDTSATTASHSICWHLDNSKKYGTKKSNTRIAQEMKLLQFYVLSVYFLLRFANHLSLLNFMLRFFCSWSYYSVWIHSNARSSLTIGIITIKAKVGRYFRLFFSPALHTNWFGVA